MIARFIAFLRAVLGLPGPWRWASVEVFGHRRHFGKVREIGWLRARFLEVVDLEREGPPERIRYGAGAIFSIQWVDEKKGRERIEMFYADRIRSRIQAEERGRREERAEELHEAVISAIDEGWNSREFIMSWVRGETFADEDEAMRAIDDAIDRNRIVEDPHGSGNFRLPTEEERLEIPF